MNGLTTAWRQSLVVAILLAGLAVGRGPRADDKPAGDVASFLVLREIDRPRRAAIESAAEWNAEAEAAAIKILQRIDAPANLVAGWRAAAAPVPAAGDPVTIADADDDRGHASPPVRSLLNRRKWVAQEMHGS